MPEPKISPSVLGKLLSPELLKWALNFGVGTAFAAVMLAAGIYFVGRLANAQDNVATAQSTVSLAIVEMKTLVSQSAAADVERQNRAETHYRETIDMRAEIARRELDAARREQDAVERSRKLLEAIQVMMDHAQAKPKPGS